MSGYISFSSVKKATGVIAVLLFITLLSYGQNVIGVVDYLKVDDSGTFVESEKEWQKVQEVRIKEDLIVGWVVYQVMFKTIEDPYNYISVTFYNSFSKLEKGIDEDILKASFPNLSSSEIDEKVNDIKAAGKIVSSGVFHRRLTAKDGLDRQSNYYVINEINIKQGKSKVYVNTKDEIYKPVYKEEMEQGNRSAWSLWEKWPGNMKDFQYVDVNGYVNLDQIDNSNFKKYFSIVHPDKNMEAIGTEVEEMSTLVNTEMWKIVFRLYK
jgi:hypothetical protein